MSWLSQLLHVFDQHEGSGTWVGAGATLAAVCVALRAAKLERLAREKLESERRRDLTDLTLLSLSDDLDALSAEVATAISRTHEWMSKQHPTRPPGEELVAFLGPAGVHPLSLETDLGCLRVEERRAEVIEMKVALQLGYARRELLQMQPYFQMAGDKVSGEIYVDRLNGVVRVLFDIRQRRDVAMERAR